MSHLVPVIDYSGVPDPIAAIHAARLERQRRIAAAAFVPPPQPKPEPTRAVVPLVDPIAVMLAKYRLVVDSDAKPSISTGKRILKECADEAGVSINDLRSDGRVRLLARARQLAMWRIAKETTLSLKQIGRLFDRDHTTVLHSIRTVNHLHGENVRGCGAKLKHVGQH